MRWSSKRDSPSQTHQTMKCSKAVICSQEVVCKQGDHLLGSQKPYHLQNHRIVWVRRDLQRSSPAMNGDAHSYIRSSEPCSASPRVSASMGHNHPPRQPVPVPHRPFCETFLPYIQSKSTLGFCTTSQIVPGSKQAIVSISTCSTQRGRKKKKERKKDAFIILYPCLHLPVFWSALEVLPQGKAYSYWQTPGQARLWASPWQLLRDITVVIRARRRHSIMYPILASAYLPFITLDDVTSVAHSSQNWHTIPQGHHQQERTHCTRGLHFENLQRPPAVYLTSQLHAVTCSGQEPQALAYLDLGLRTTHTQRPETAPARAVSILDAAVTAFCLLVSGIELHISASKSRRYFSRRSLQLQREKSLQKALMNYLPTWPRHLPTLTACFRYPRHKGMWPVTGLIWKDPSKGELSIKRINILSSITQPVPSRSIESHT